MIHFIVLKGRGNSGKTETISLVYQQLKSKYPSLKENVLIQNTIDIKVILAINDQKIGIESQGDPLSRLKQSLSDFVTAGCNIIICATRTYGMTVDWFNNYSTGNQTDFIQQNYTNTNQSISNNKTASDIILMAGL